MTNSHLVVSSSMLVELMTTPQYLKNSVRYIATKIISYAYNWKYYGTMTKVTYST